MKAITIYEIIEAAEKKYIDSWGKLKTLELIAAYIDVLKTLIAKTKEEGKEISIENSVVYAIKIFPEKTKLTSTKTYVDFVMISAFKMACEKGGPFSGNLIKMISINFMDIILSLKEKPKEELSSLNDMTTNLQAQCPKCNTEHDYVLHYSDTDKVIILTCPCCQHKFDLIIKK